jgi:tetratricopeptide (TPR) repeat protein
MSEQESAPWREALIVLRLVVGWSQPQLAQAAGMSGAIIADFDRGPKAPSAAHRLRLVAAMGFPSWQLDRAVSFVQQARAARQCHLGVAVDARAEAIALLTAEAGRWLEDLVGDALLSALAEPKPAGPVQTRSAISARGAVETGAPATHQGSVPRRSKRGPLDWTRAVKILRVVAMPGARVPPPAIQAIPVSHPAAEERVPRVLKMQRAASAMGFPPAVVERTVAFVASALAARQWHLQEGDAQRALREQIAGFAAAERRSFEALVNGSLNRYLMVIRCLSARKAAPVLWARLEEQPAQTRRALVREGPEFCTSGLCELVCERSVEAAWDRAALALELAELAVEIAARVEGEELWRHRVNGLALAHLANATRVAGNLPTADETLARAKEHWIGGAAGDPGLLNEARVLQIEASLRRAQRRLPEALALIEQALAEDRWGVTVSLLIARASALEGLGRFEEAIAQLNLAGSRIDTGNLGSDLRTLCVVRANRLWNLCHLGRYAEAELGLGEVMALARKLGNGLDLVRINWLAGTVAAGLGRISAALAALESVRGKFIAGGIAYDAALVTLELAEIHAAQGDTVLVKTLARESAPIFCAQAVHREAQVALDFFRRAAESEALSAQLVRHIYTYLQRGRHNADVQFEATG